MKAVILVGGEATRLRPLTCNLPKGMMPVLNVPFLEHVINYLRRHHITEVVLARSHLSEPVEDHLGDGCQFGVKIHYAVEENLLGTAGAVKNAEGFLNDTFLVLNGDIFTDLDITAMIDLHREKGARATIALTPVDDPTSYGLVETNEQGKVTRFLEKPSWDEVTTNMINAGTYVLEYDVLNRIPMQVSFSFERELFPSLLDRGEPVYTFPSSAYWIDIGTPEKYLQLNKDLLGGRGSQYGFTLGKEIRVGEQGYIHPTAHVSGPILMGDKCTIGPNARIQGPAVIGPGCEILEGSVIEASVVWQNTRLEPGVSLKNSVVASACCLNANSTIEDAVLGDNVTVSSHCTLEPASRIWPGTTVEPTQPSESSP